MADQRQILRDEIKSVQSYVTLNTMFKTIKEDVENAATASDYLLSFIDSDNTEALVYAQDIRKTIKSLHLYLSRYQAAQDMDGQKYQRKLNQLELDKKALVDRVTELEEQIELMNTKFDEEVELKVSEIRQEFKNAEVMADTFEKVLSLLGSIQNIDDTVKSVNGISDYVKRLQANQQKPKAVANEAVAFKDTVSTDVLVKDYESEGYKVTKALIEKYSPKLTKQGIIERLKSAGVYRGRVKK